MKKTILTLVFAASLAAAGGAFGDAETLAGSGHFHSGGFGGPVFKVTSLAGEAAFVSGGRGGWIINHTFVLGGGGYAVHHGHCAFAHDTGELALGYGGLELEYIGFSDKLVHFTVLATLAYGSASFRPDTPATAPERTSGLFVAEPTVSAELNVIRWLRVDAGAGYRYVVGSDIEGVSDADLSGVAAVITLKFGSF